MKYLIQFIFVTFFVLFLFFPFEVFGISFLKSYMLFISVSGLTLLPIIKIYKLYPYELAWLLLMIYLPLTFIFGDDYASAFRAIVGEFVLIFFYFLFRFLLVEIGIEKLNKIMCKIGKWFYIISLILFFIGAYYYYIKDVNYFPLFYSDQTNRVFGGIFNKWTNMPRLTGLSLGSYSFNWMSSLFILGFLQNKLYKWALIGLLCSLMTLSMTFVTLLIIVLAYIIFKRGKLIQATIALILVFGVGFYYYNTNSWFNYIIQTRIEDARTGTGRFEIWNYVLDKAMEKPIFGHGINQLKSYLESYHDETIRSAHNTFFEIFFNAGIVGLSFYLFFLVAFYIVCSNLDKQVRGYYFKGFFLCYFIYTSTNTGIYIFDPLIYMGFIFIYLKHFRESKETETKRIDIIPSQNRI